MAALFSFAPGLVFAKPGNEVLLQTKSITAPLYICSVSYDDSAVTSAEVALVPPSMQKICVGRSLEDCRDEDRARKVKLNSWDGEVPSQVLTLVVSDLDTDAESVALLKKVQLLKTLPQRASSAGHQEFETSLDSRKSINSTVIWELFANGESFRLP